MSQLVITSNKVTLQMARKYKQLNSKLTSVSSLHFVNKLKSIKTPTQTPHTMNSNNITPAITKDETGPAELSAEEFQKRLYSWFEDRGLLSELRAHLRMQMISILKDTTIGKNTSGQFKQTISPKVQAINLLIAEFLLNQDYFYTLSVFSSEAPMINVLPDCSGSFVSKPKNGARKWRFTEKDMWDILETLGIQRANEDGREISGRYCAEGNSEALLTCILRVVHKGSGKEGAKEVRGEKCTKASCSSPDRNVTSSIGNNNDKAIADKNTNPVVKELIALLNSCGLHPTSKDNLLEKLTNVINAEQNRKIQEQKEAFAKLEASLNEKAAQYENEYKRRIEKLTQTFEKVQRKFQDEQKQKQAQLDTYSDSIHKQNQQIRNHLNEMITRDRALEEKEQSLERQQIELDRREKRLQSEYESLYEEKVTLSELQNKLTTNDGTTLNPNECTSPRHDPQVFASETVMTDNREITDNAQQTSENRRDIEEALMKGMVRQMQLENSHLRTVNNEQMLRIQELSSRASTLCRELESSYGRVSSINAFHHSTTAGILTAPLLSPSPRTRTSRVSFNGSGEEGVRVLPTPPPRMLRNLGHRESRRKAPTRRPTPTPSTSGSEEHTPTDEVLQETKERLKLLEQESEEIDRNFRRFHRSNREAEGPQMPGTGWLESCRQAMFDVADFFYNDNDGAIPGAGYLNEMPSTSRGRHDFDLGSLAFPPAFKFPETSPVYGLPLGKLGKKPEREKSEGFNFKFSPQNLSWSNAFGKKFKAKDAKGNLKGGDETQGSKSKEETSTSVVNGDDARMENENGEKACEN